MKLAAVEQAPEQEWEIEEIDEYEIEEIEEHQVPKSVFLDKEQRIQVIAELNEVFLL